MPFKKGTSGNIAGKPKGTTNKASNQLRELISGFLEDRFQDVVNDFKKLSPKERVKSYTDLLQFAVPKLQNTSLDVDFERLDEDQLDEIIERLKEVSNDEA